MLSVCSVLVVGCLLFVVCLLTVVCLVCVGPVRCVCVGLPVGLLVCLVFGERSLLTVGCCLLAVDC